MGAWVRHSELEGGEVVKWTKAANRQQSELRAVGGKLFLTDRRLLFQPNRFFRLPSGWTGVERGPQSGRGRRGTTS